MQTSLLLLNAAPLPALHRVDLDILFSPTPPVVKDEHCCWQYWQSQFKKSRSDLLGDYVDPVEEKHMELVKDSNATWLAKVQSPKYYE